VRVLIGDQDAVINRVAGMAQRPIARLDGCSDRSAVQALAGRTLLVARELAPELEPEQWWAEDLEGCVVRDVQGPLGKVRRLLALPSCEVLEVEREDGAGDLLVPLVKDAVRAVDLERGVIEVDRVFLWEG